MIETISAAALPKGADPAKTTMKVCCLMFNRDDWAKLEKMAEVARQKIPTMNPERVIEIIVTAAVQNWQPGSFADGKWLADPSDQSDMPDQNPS